MQTVNCLIRHNVQLAIRQCFQVTGLGDCMNFTITIIVLKTLWFPIISYFVIIWRSKAYLQYIECLLHYYSLLYVCYLNFRVLFALKSSAFSLQTVTKCLFSGKLSKYFNITIVV